jgi:hypothetical protein
MKTPKVGKTPAPAAAVPLPQLDSPELIDVQRSRRREASEREGSSQSLLAGGGAGDTSTGGTRKKRLGSGALAY